MRAVRAVNPLAQLFQTEDAAHVFSTRRLDYQARFENQRRFASLDILTGRLGPDHPLHEFLLSRGVDRGTLDSFVADPCAPDMIGINYYVTSDRFLDDRIHDYPPHTHGGNGVERYADVEAVRVRDSGIVGHRQVLEEMWQRYRIPLALGEVHLTCGPEDQVRWLVEAWRAATEARENGIDVRGVTAWAAFGTKDWDSLLVERRGRYEPGLFDVRGSAVEATALAAVARDLGKTGASSHPMLAGPGWWRRDDRFAYPQLTVP
jgi:dTDP-4-dehydrorhamnose reductase